jgi:hypothetical protein
VGLLVFHQTRSVGLAAATANPLSHLAVQLIKRVVGRRRPN